MNIAIIPARGGSKRIPRKNIKLFNGMPIISYAIKTAIESGIFARIIVSTEDPEIQQISKDCGAEVPWLRSSELADDFATTVDVMKESALNLLDSVNSTSSLCCLYPTTPLLSPESLILGLKLLQNHDYVISAVRNDPGLQRAFELDEKGIIHLLFPKHETTRTQDLPMSYSDAGQFYWGSLETWSKGLPIFSSDSTIIELSQNEVVDIDTDQDWEKAESIYIKLKKGANRD